MQIPDFFRHWRAYLASRRWPLWYGVAFALLSLLPYALAWQSQGDAWRFTGFLVGVEDGNSYIAKMLLGTQGLWLFRPPYSTWQVAPLPVFLFYIGLGKLAGGAAPHLQLTVLYHLVRVVAVVLVALATYDFAAVFVESERSRRWVVMLATAGAGLGLWGMLAGVQFGGEGGALCCYSPEAFGFLAMFFLPHVTLGRALLLWLLRAVAQRQWRFWHGALMLTALAVVQPLELLVFVLVAALLLGWQWLVAQTRPRVTDLAWGAWAVGLGLGYAAMPFWHAYARVWGQQNVVLATAWWHYLWAYAWLWPLAAAGVWHQWRQGQRARLWVGVWALVFPVFAFLPVTNARRLVDGGWVALGVAVAWGCEALCRRRGRWLAYGILAVAWVPALAMLGMLTRQALNPALPAFRPAEEVAAFQAVAQQAQSGDGVLAAYATGNALPAWAPVRVIAGLGPESPDLPRQKANLQRFFAPDADDAWRQAFLAENHLLWVFYGPAERALGAWQPDSAGFLCPRYRSEHYALFEVCP